MLPRSYADVGAFGRQSLGQFGGFGGEELLGHRLVAFTLVLVAFAVGSKARADLRVARAVAVTAREPI